MSAIDPETRINLTKATIAVIDGGQHSLEVTGQILKGFGVAVVQRYDQLADATKAIKTAFEKVGVKSIGMQVDLLEVARQTRLFPGKVSYEEAAVASVTALFAEKSPAFTIEYRLYADDIRKLCLDKRETKTDK